ncbi:MAG: hypothetical protein KF761_00355 [Salinibacterium sp.]|nr:hypothetical protein [Salinibacterium sp.]
MSRPSRKGFWAAIIVGGSVLLVALIVAVSLLAVRVGQSALLGGPPPDAVVEGDPSSATASEPDECPDVCFTTDDIRATITSASDVVAIGLDKQTAAWGDYIRTTPIEEFDWTADAWSQDQGTPDSCFFAYYATPVVDPLAAPPVDNTDTIDVTDVHVTKDETTSYSQSVRIFGTSSEATAYMSSLEQQISGCSNYTTTFDGSDGLSTLRIATSIPVPANVAAVGWVENSGFGRYYSFDVQRSNLVVRTYVITYNAVSEEGFRTLITDLATRVGEMVPKGD